MCQCTDGNILDTVQDTMSHSIVSKHSTHMHISPLPPSTQTTPATNQYRTYTSSATQRATRCPMYVSRGCHNANNAIMHWGTRCLMFAGDATIPGEVHWDTTYPTHLSPSPVPLFPSSPPVPLPPPPSQLSPLSYPPVPHLFTTCPSCPPVSPHLVPLLSPPPPRPLVSSSCSTCPLPA